MSAPKNVLIIRNAFTYDFGGAERLAVHIAEDIQKRGIKTVVSSCQPRLRDYAIAQGIAVRTGLWWSKQNWSGKGLLLLPLYLLWQIFLTLWYAQLLLRLRPTAVHILSKDDFIAGTLAAKLLGKRVVWTDCADLKYVLANYTVWYRNPVGKLVYWCSRLADGITLVSDSEKKLVSAALGRPLPANYHVVHIGAKTQTVVPLARKKEDKDAVVFCATSRLVTAKGIGELVDAFTKLSGGSNTYRLWIVGDGLEEDAFKKRAGKNPNLVFVGHSDTPLEYVAGADVFVHPSYHEGFSLSLTEAAMLGKPLIACTVGGNPELVNNKNGVLVPARDAHALYEAMRLLGSDKDAREAKGKQAQKDYFDNFEFSRLMEKEVIPLYG